VLLAKDGKVLFKNAYGLASKRFDVPNRIDTKFNLGSMNKMFTAVAVAQLVERGKLSFDDPVSKYLSADWLPRDVTDKITVRHLLTHTSGLGSYFNEKYQLSSRMRFRDLDDYRVLVAADRPSFKPGTSWKYSNTGFLLLGVIIERVTGMSYFDYVQKHIHGPAGMTNTACYAMDRPVPNLAIGYTKVGQGADAHWENNLYKHVIKGAAAGGGFSTVEDLLRFDQAMRANKLVKAETAAVLWTPTEQSNKGRPYGMGFGIDGQLGNRIVGHSGGFSGINAELLMYLDKGYTVAVMANYDGAATVVADQLREWLARAE
jgi:CubicO group peptidase (beta-lactamase class C family)